MKTGWMKTGTAMALAMIALVFFATETTAEEQEGQNRSIEVAMMGTPDGSPPSRAYREFGNTFFFNLLERANDEYIAVDGNWAVLLFENPSPHQIIILAIKGEEGAQPIDVAKVSLDVAVTSSGMDAVVKQTMAVIRRYKRQIF